MRARRMTGALLSLIALQIVGSLGFLGLGVAAQSDDLVAVMSLFTGRDVCEVQYRKSDNDQWGEDSREGPPVACSGGMVVTEIMSQAEADEIVDDFEVIEREGRSSA